MQKKYDIPDKCIECKHSVIEHSMWLCLYHKIDIEEHDCELCGAFEKGFTYSNANNLQYVVESINNLLKFSKENEMSFEHRFLRDQLSKIVKKYKEE